MSDKFQDIYRIPSARASWWDYQNDASYFVTICTAGREHYFGEISNEIMYLSAIGKIAHQNWVEIPNHFPFIRLDAFVVMPNHVHGILVIDKPINFILPVETLHATSLPQTPQTPQTPLPPSLPNQQTIKNEEMAEISPKRGSLSSVIRSYKSSVSKQVHEIHADFDWQTRFHDHIIRDESEYWKIREYILNNQKRWGDDKYNRSESL